MTQEDRDNEHIKNALSSSFGLAMGVILFVVFQKLPNEILQAILRLDFGILASLLVVGIYFFLGYPTFRGLLSIGTIIIVAYYIGQLTKANPEKSEMWKFYVLLVVLGSMLAAGLIGYDIWMYRKVQKEINKVN